jgi:RimJ/RimL family protein N-acetyltransferase
VISIRRARGDDVDFLVELANNEEVHPFLGARAPRAAEEIRAEVDRSSGDPTRFGRFVVEVDGEPAGATGFEVANARSRIAQLERLAIHPDFRGRRVGDKAARLLQRHLVVDLGYHRLQLEIYGFNERAQRHADRAGYVREGVRRKAYWRHGDWTDGVLYAVIREDLDVPPGIALLHDYVLVHNECVRTADWEPLGEWFTEDAELAFDGVPVGPFEGREAIADAYRERPPDDEVVIFGTEEQKDTVVAGYGWLQKPAEPAGRMIVTPHGDRIAKLVVTFARSENVPAS